MKKTLSLILTLVGFSTSNAQVVDFESLQLAPNSYENGSNLQGKFEVGPFEFINNYDTTYQSWEGFAYSNMTDTVTTGFMNQYSARPGNGADNSTNYAVAYFNDYFVHPIKINLKSTQLNAVFLKSVSITNSTYAALDMLNGNPPYSKKFGGASGNDPDYFFLVIHAYYNNNDITKNVALADYRFTNSNNDFVLTNWQKIDLGNVPVDSIRLYLHSSDNGSFGMNTPAYVCIDNLEYDFISSINTQSFIAPIIVYPNPANHNLNITNNKGLVELYNQYGQLVKSTFSNDLTTKLDIADLAQGIYYIQTFDLEGRPQQQKIVKQ